MGYDDIILKMGEFGRYQRKIYLLLCLPAIVCAFHKLAGVSLGAKMNSRCLLPWEDENATFYLSADTMNMSYPWDSKVHGWSQCTRRENLTTFNSDEHTKCREFVYDTSVFQRTITSEWHLVCDRAWMRPFGDSLFMVGVMLGSIVFGGLSDKFGRRPIFFLCLVLQLLSGILVAVAPEYISFVIFRMIVGATSMGVYLVAYVIALEMVGPKKRLICSVGYQLCFACGYIVLANLGYLLNDWRYLQMAITLPGCVFLIYWWFIPESIRWLLIKGRHNEVKESLDQVARENNVEISVSAINDLLTENDTSMSDNKQASMLDLFRYPNLRKKSLLLFFNWFVNSGTYYGLSWNASNLGGNIHMNFLISGLVEIPAYTLLIFTLNRWGRKKILCGSMMIAGAALLATILFPPGHWGIIAFAMIGKLAITSSYGTIYIFTAEQFPTVVRNIGLGACSTSARIGGIIAPQILFLSQIWIPFPLVIFGTCVFVGGIASLLLPETLNKKLPETMKDGELFGLEEKNSKRNKIKDIYSNFCLHRICSFIQK